MAAGNNAHDGTPLTVKHSGGWLPLLGLPFLFVGGIFLVIAYSLFSSLYAPVFFLCIGLFFVSIGAVLVVFREKIVIDGRAGLLVSEKRLIVPVSRKVRRVDGYTAVTLKEVPANGRKAGQEKFVFEVLLTAEGVHRRPLLVACYAQYGQAAAVARDLARYLGWQFTDLAASQPAESEASLGVRVESAWCPQSPPARTKIVQRVTAQQAEIFIPAAGYAARERHYLIFSCLWPGFVSLAFLLPMLQESVTDNFDHAAFVTFVLLSFVVLAFVPTAWAVLGAVRSATMQSRVLFDPHRLSVQQRWLFGESNEVIAISDQLCVRQGETEPQRLLPGLFVWPALWLGDQERRVAIASRVLGKEDLEWLAGLVRCFQQRQAEKNHP